MNYISFLPSKLDEIIISFLYLDDLTNLLIYIHNTTLLNSTTVNDLHLK